MELGARRRPRRSEGDAVDDDAHEHDENHDENTRKDEDEDDEEEEDDDDVVSFSSGHRGDDRGQKAKTPLAQQREPNLNKPASRIKSALKPPSSTPSTRSSNQPRPPVLSRSGLPPAPPAKPQAPRPGSVDKSQCTTMPVTSRAYGFSDRHQPTDSSSTVVMTVADAPHSNKLRNFAPMATVDDQMETNGQWEESGRIAEMIFQGQAGVSFRTLKDYLTPRLPRGQAADANSTARLLELARQGCVDLTELARQHNITLIK